MKKDKKILITDARHELIRVRRHRLRLERRFCPLCEIVSEMLTLDSAVTHSRLATFQIINLIRDGGLHAVEAESGHLLVCAASLRAMMQKQ